jgi:outer membrane protein TolC
MLHVLLKKVQNRLGILLLLGLLQLPLHAESLTLNQLFEKALNQSDFLAQQQSELNSAQASIDLTRAGQGPSLTLTAGSSLYAQPPGTNSDTTTAFINLGLTQSLLPIRSLDFASHSFELQRNALQLQHRHQQLVLYKTISSLYLNALRLYEQKNHLEALKTLLEKRLYLMESWVKIGKSPASDVSSIRVQVSQLELNAIQLRTALEAAKLQLQFYTRSPKPLDIDFRLPSPPLSALEPKTWINRASDHPAVKALELVVEAKREDINTEKTFQEPKILGGLSGQYLSTAANKTNVQASIAFSQSLVDSGAQQAKLIKSEEALHQAEITLSSTKIMAETTIKTAVLTATQALKTKQQSQLLLSQANVYAQQIEKDYALKLISNVDVLKGFMSLLDAQNQDTDSKIQAQTAWIDLHLSVGELP